MPFSVLQAEVLLSADDDSAVAGQAQLGDSVGGELVEEEEAPLTPACHRAGAVQLRVGDGYVVVGGVGVDVGGLTVLGRLFTELVESVRC